MLVWSTCASLWAGVLGCGGVDDAERDAAAVPAGEVVVDGSSWTRIEDPDGVFGIRDEANVRLSDVVAGGPGYVAVGGYGQGHHGEGGTVAAVWTSEDGTTWERVPHDDDVFGPFGSGRFTVASAVTTGGPGLIAVGIEADGEALVALAWLSTDGREWTRVEVDDPRERGATDLDLHAIADTDDGLVAVGIGRSGPAGAPEEPAAWRSNDGVGWTPIALTPEEDAAAWGFLSTVAAYDGEVVAAGASDGPDGERWVATVWHGSDTDGLTRILHDDEVFGGPGMPWIHGLTTGGPGLVAVGTTHSHHLDDPQWSPAAVWTSDDGAAWERVAHDDEVFGDDDDATMYDVVATEWGLIAVGHRVPSQDDPAQMRFIGTVWTSPDGLAWTRLVDEDGTFSGDGHTSLAAIGAGPEGLVAVGEVGAGEGSTIGGCGPAHEATGRNPVCWSPRLPATASPTTPPRARPRRARPGHRLQ